MPSDSRTPLRTFILGCTTFAGFDSVGWENSAVPNIPDYDLVIVSVSHVTEDFLKSVDHDYIRDLRRALVRFLDSGGKMVVLGSRNFTAKRPSRYPEEVSSNFWCPIAYATPKEAGKGIVRKQNMYSHYLNKMSEWSFYLTIPSNCLTDELTRFYGSVHERIYRVPLESYIESRYGRVLAGHIHIEVQDKPQRSSVHDRASRDQTKTAGHETGAIVFLPLVDRVSPEEALAEILQAEVGFSVGSPEPDWASEIEMPRVPELVSQVEAAQTRMSREREIVEQLEAQIADIRSFRRLLYSTGPELEAIVKRSLELLGATVSPSKYAQEEYILEYDGEEYLMEVKGVAKSISLTHLRQLNDYLLTYEEETGKECKGILFGNAWRNTRPEMRGTKDTPEFPNNVVKRAEQWGISLVSSKAFFAAFVRALRAPHLSNDVLTTLTRSSGLAFPPDERSSGTEASHSDDRSGSRTGSVPSDGGDEEKPEGDRQVEETPDAAIESRPEGAHRD